MVGSAGREGKMAAIGGFGARNCQLIATSTGERQVLVSRTRAKNRKIDSKSKR
jgi:hypothetical protein